MEKIFVDTNIVLDLLEKREGFFEEAQELIRQGDQAFTEGHHIHADLLALDANGELNQSGLILMHAEDQLMSAETFRIMAEEFIEVYKKLLEVEE